MRYDKIIVLFCCSHFDTLLCFLLYFVCLDCVKFYYTISHADILDLLDDGYYVVVDVPMYPTDGSDRFFANVPDKLTDKKAATADYYSSDFMDVSDVFPAYIYPTQSNSMERC